MALDNVMKMEKMLQLVSEWESECVSEWKLEGKLIYQSVLYCLQADN